MNGVEKGAKVQNQTSSQSRRKGGTDVEASQKVARNGARDAHLWFIRRELRMLVSSKSLQTNGELDVTSDQEREKETNGAIDQ